MTASTTPAYVELDPADLAAHPGNIRDDLGDLTELTASIRAVGVIEPVLVSPVVTRDGNDDASSGYRILAGHRRVAAAVKAKIATVPCVIRADLDTDPDALVTMIVENVHRAALTATEEAAAYAQLAAFDLTPGQIAERTGRKAKTVRDALKLHGLPEQVKRPVADGTITLEQAADIAKYADDEKAHARLIKAAESGYGLAYAIADERHRRDRNTRKAANRKTLEKAGVTIVGKPKGFPYDSAAARVVDLTLTDGVTRYTADTHADCPGHAAFLDPTSGEPVLICRDPDEHGHMRVAATSHVSTEEARRREAEEATRAQRAEALTVAAEVRRAFARDLIGASKAAPHLIRAALAALFAYIEDARSDHLRLVADLLDLDTQQTSIGRAYAARLDKTTETRLWQHTVAHAAALAEGNLDRLAAGRAWGYRPLLTATWLDLLETCGYQPSDVERVVRAEADAADEPDGYDEQDDVLAEDEQDGAESDTSI